jgi:hypothetical protein
VSIRCNECMHLKSSVNFVVSTVILEETFSNSIKLLEVKKIHPE